MITLIITPRDPIVARDARPAGTGNRLRSLNWIYPSVLAGSLRTLLGKTAAPQHIAHPFDDETLIERLKETSVTGPFPCAKNTLFFPAPRDLIICDKNDRKHLMPLRPEPLSEGEGCDLPSETCWPIAITEDAKPAPAAPAFWSQDRMAAWLAEDLPQNFPMPAEDADGFLGVFQKEDRVHASIDPVRFAADDGRLFSTQGLSISADDLSSLKERMKQTGLTLSARVSGTTDDLQQALSGLSAWHPLGGERRLVHFQTGENAAPWACPDEIAQALSGAKGVRMVLATPAIFAGGWLPGWLNPDSLEGAPPNCAVRLKLRGACAGRWQPLSGWSLEKGRLGPKAVRRLVPEGSVYFFEILSGNPQELTRLWLDCVSDDAQDRRDGFGASLWGIWNMPQSQENVR